MAQIYSRHARYIDQNRRRYGRDMGGFISGVQTTLDATGAAANFTANAAAEVFVMTVTAGNVDTADSTIAFDGVTVTVTNPSATPTAIADDFATQYNAAGTGTWTAVGNGDGTVTFTANANEDRTDIVGGDFVYTANTADAVAVTFSVASPTTQGVDPVITWTTHGKAVGDGPFLLTTTTTLPAGLSLATYYWISAIPTANTISLSTRKNAPVHAIVGDAGTGTHTITKASDTGAMFEYLKQTNAAVLGGETDVDNL